MRLHRLFLVGWLVALVGVARAASYGDYFDGQISLYMVEDASRSSYSYSGQAVKHVARVYVCPRLSHGPHAPSGGHDPNGCAIPGDTDSYGTLSFSVASPGEMGKFDDGSVKGSAGTVATSPTSTGPGMVFADVQPGDKIPIHLVAGSDGVLRSGQLVFMLYWDDTIKTCTGTQAVWCDTHQKWEGVPTWSSKRVLTRTTCVLDLTKNLCTADVSVDSRKAYGQPNLGGELPGDPNAPQRPVNFGAWQYKGGLFLGNAPYTSTGDLSGTARIQLKTNVTGSGTYLGATLAMLPLGVVNRSGFMTSFGIGVYMPSSSDPNLSFAESGVTWDTKWNIQPGLETQPVGDWTKKAYLVQSVSPSTSTTTPLNFQIGRSQYVAYLSDPAAAFGNLCLALVDENKIVNGLSPYGSQTPCWIYFASKEYPGANTVIPGGDCAPRIWRLGLVDVTQW